MPGDRRQILSLLRLPIPPLQRTRDNQFSTRRRFAQPVSNIDSVNAFGQIPEGFFSLERFKCWTPCSMGFPSGAVAQPRPVEVWAD